MKNNMNEEKAGFGIDQEKRLQRHTAMMAATLKLLRRILDKVEEIDVSLSILATQKARELDPEDSTDATPT